jgi:hypothetical protein
VNETRRTGRISTIGSRPSGTSDGKTVFAFNVRCLEGVDLEGLTIKQVDGKSFYAW